MADHESNNLIDWSGPVVEYANKPLIPLPFSSNPIDIGEDNPFDAIERQINENELLDIFNINLSFNENDSKGEDVANDSSVEIIVDCVDGVLTSRGSNEFIGDDLSGTFPEKNANGISHDDTSFISSLSSLSDFKEMVQSRISCYVNQALNSKHATTFSAHSSFECGKSTSFSEPSKLNDCFVQQDSELRNVEGECEDLQSIKLNWDEYLMSSSDEENEKPIFLEKLKLSNQAKKTPSKQFLKTREVRAPLICQDPNIRIKKISVALKQGPLKAVVPISNMEKLEDRKSITVRANAKIMPSSKSRVTSTIDQCKLKKWYSPVATSTPQNSKTSSPNFSKLSLTSNSFLNSSTHKKIASRTFSHPPSPDSTSDSKVFSRVTSAVRMTPKTNLKNVSSSVVSSSTKIKDQSRTPVRTTKVVGARSLVSNVRNKENLKPFRH